MSTVHHFDESSFDQHTQGAQPVLVDFWAEWCGPCRMLTPILDQLAKDYDGKVTIAKVNVDEHPGLAQRFGITSIPNLKLFKSGVEIDNIVGAAPLATLKGRLDQHL